MTLGTMLPDVFGLGFLLAAGGGLAIWGVGYGAMHRQGQWDMPPSRGGENFGLGPANFVRAPR